MLQWAQNNQTTKLNYSIEEIAQKYQQLVCVAASRIGVIKPTKQNTDSNLEYVQRPNNAQKILFYLSLFI